MKKKNLALLCLVGLLCFSQPAWAAPFPNKTKDVVQDANNYLVKKDREAFAEAIKQFSDKYKVVVVESTQPEAKSADEYAHLLYDNYNLDDDTMMIVLDYNSQQLGVYPGENLQQKGAKMEMLHEKIISYYEPFRNQKDYLEGIQTFITEVNTEYGRIKAQQSAKTTTGGAGADSGSKPADSTKSLWSDIQWWVYAAGLVFVALLAVFIYTFIRRRQIFSDLDDTEDWKDQLVDKIQQIDIDKPLRRSTGKTEEWQIELANRKEHLLHVRIIDIEMMIMEAEEACDRFRFAQARDLIKECRETLESIEIELSELKQDTLRIVSGNQERPAQANTQSNENRQNLEQRQSISVVQSKKMPNSSPDADSQLQAPAIGKLFEGVERKLTNLRLEYGLSFHELKVALDQVEHMRSESEGPAATGDAAAIEQLQAGQLQLQELAKTLEAIPALVHHIEKELRDELKQLEEGIVNATSDGYDLGESDLDAALLQVKTVLKDARNALEEGYIEKAKKLANVFHVSLEKTYERIEDSLAGNKAAAAAKAPATIVRFPAAETELVEPTLQEELDAARIELLEKSAVQEETAANAEDRNEDAVMEEEASQEAEPGPATELAAEQTHDIEAKPELLLPEVEYELVIPKAIPANEPMSSANPHELVIESEDDVLDELERINGVLVRIRQQLKRSYLPGIPDQLKYYFEQSVHNLSQITLTMERYKYSLEEVTVLLNEANELLAETELLAERTIATCQLAEGAIQYTNRYRRQNRQVNELLTKAEQAFRQLEFAEALKLAEKARLIVEGGEPQTGESRWLLRRKQKGMGH